METSEAVVAGDIANALQLGDHNRRRDHNPCAIRLLIIDDEIRADDALVGVLVLEGFTVTCAQSAATGLGLANSMQLDAILLDLHLPDIL